MNTGNPNNQIRNHSAAIYFVKHFVPTARVEIVSDRRDPWAAIAIDKRTHFFQPLPDRIVPLAGDIPEAATCAELSG